MFKTIKSVLIWIGVVFLIVIWVPILAAVRLVDRDPARYRTGRTFRNLGKFITRINPEWKIRLYGNIDIDDRRPYIVICNHLSNADIPLISILPWEMKWIAKKELFELPFVGWLMKMAGDIPVDRRDPNKQLSTMKRAIYYLRNDCSVMFFPEGTRSRTGKLGRFTNGAFHLSIKEGIPVLPMAIDGTQNCLPKKSWKFGEAPDIKLKVLDPVDSAEYESGDVEALRDHCRTLILRQLAEWRNEDISAIDAAG